MIKKFLTQYKLVSGLIEKRESLSCDREKAIQDNWEEINLMKRPANVVRDWRPEYVNLDFKNPPCPPPALPKTKKKTIEDSVDEAWEKFKP